MRQVGLLVMGLWMAGIFQTTAAQSVASNSMLTIQIIPVVGEKNWSLEDAYTNALGETFSIDKCLFYLSNFALQSSSGKWYPIRDSYFLVNISDSSSLQINLPGNISDVVSIQFLLGVDSAKNVNGIQSGVLDPARVTRSALINAASIAGLMLTTEVMITKVDEDEPGSKVAGAIR
jgi:hypothetical protein